MLKRRRVTLPVLIVLLAFLGGAGYLVYRAHEDTVAGDDAEGALATALDADPLDALGDHEAEGEERDGRWRHHDWGTGHGDDGAHRPHGRSPHGDSNGESNRIPPATVNDEIYDPQMSAMRRSYRMETDGGAGALPFSPSEHEASIVDSEGDLGLSPGATCQVRVLPVRTQMFNCLARVVCDGRVLYPNPSQTAGYVPCDIEGGQAVSAVDDGHSAADGDPLIRLDLRNGTVTVEDRGDGVSPFRATLRIGRRRS